MKTILVCGGAGFIGSNLCSYLLNKGEKVICVDNFSTGNMDNVKDFDSPLFSIIKHDITEPLEIDESIDEISQAILNILPEAEIEAEEAEGLLEDKIIILSGVVSKKRYTKTFFNTLLEWTDLDKLNDDELKILIDLPHADDLFAYAILRRKEYYGTDVYTRGLIEFTNYCKNNC